MMRSGRTRKLRKRSPVAEGLESGNRRHIGTNFADETAIMIIRLVIFLECSVSIPPTNYFFLDEVSIHRL
ncbi:hypothetical protein SAMN05216332_102375 [Nitrosospira briensis]|nr:hypothetical protein SAMN05216332_102375 [Nitrosospira briensis]